MPTIIKTGTRRFRITCPKCECLLGFYAYEVEQKLRTSYADTEEVQTIDCPACTHEIQLPWNYKSTLQSDGGAR